MVEKAVKEPFEGLAGDPKHVARATRSAGRKMRSLLLDAASPLFRQRGLSGASITDIAAAANAFPSQITYYFRTKEALFVECACREWIRWKRNVQDVPSRRLAELLQKSAL